MPEVPQDPQDPCIVISVRAAEDLVLVRSGQGLLTTVRPGIRVRFSGGGRGVLLAWKECVAVLHLFEGTVQVGESVQSEKEFFTTFTGKSLFGRIVGPTGQTLDGPLPPLETLQPRGTFVEYKGMQERTNQYRPLFTGVLGVDFAVPVGRGQTMLFQGTDMEQDRRYLWPDLMAIDKSFGARPGPAHTVTVVRDMAEAERFREELQQRGCWERCTIVVPDTSGPGSRTLAMHAAVTIAEEISDQDGDISVLVEFEPMHRVWNVLAEVAGEERRAKGIIIDPKDTTWTEMEGTVITESIAERRKFWFALVSRAANSVEGGTVSILAWVWEQQGGYDHRKQKGYELKLKQIADIPRIADAVREKMIKKVEAEAAAEGIPIGSNAVVVPEPDPDTPGVPNWEIEELKSITDGHILLQRPVFYAAAESGGGAPWSWKLDPYRSLPRLGTDALHPALISTDAHKVRLRMLQGRDRANLLHDTKEALLTLGTKERLELRFVELMLEQPAGAPQTIEEEMARLVIVACPSCEPLQDPNLGCSPQRLAELVPRLLSTGAGGRATAEIRDKGEVSQEALDQMRAEVLSWPRS